MNSRDIISLKKDIFLYLSKRQLKDAFQSLTKLTKNVHNWKISETLGELETNYKFMLHYMFEGVDDPERENVYRNLLRSLYELTDDSADELLKIESSNVFYEKYRINTLKNSTIRDYEGQLKDIAGSISLVDLLEDGDEKNNRKRELAVRRERIASDMFNAVFVSPRTDEIERANYLSFVNSIELSLREKCLFLSAINLSLFHRFDSHKIQLLMDVAISENTQLRARAIVGLVVVMQMYDTRWSLYPELQSRLAIMSENQTFRKSVLRIIIQLIRSRETEQISKKIREEIMPEMKKALGKSFYIPLKIPHCLVLSIAGLSGFVGKFMKNPPVFNYDKGVDFIQPYWISSVARAKRDFGYSQQISLEQGMKISADWYKQQGWL